MDQAEQDSDKQSDGEYQESMETNESDSETNPLKESGDSEASTHVKESKYELRRVKREPDDEEPRKTEMELKECDTQGKEMDSMFASVWVKVEMVEEEREEPEEDDSTDVNYEPRQYQVEKKSKKQDDKNEVKKKPRKVPTKILNCSQCDYTTTYTSALNTHMVGHSSEKKFSCNECNYRSKYQNALTRHIKIQHRNDNSPSTVSDKIYYCDQCEYTTNFPWNLKAHKRKHSSKEFKCEHCPFETAYRHNYLKHKKTHDPKENTLTVYRCDKCTFVTKYEGHITRHLAQIHNEITDMSQKCDKCDFSTRVRWRLNVHKVKSKVDSPLQCKHCEFQSFYKCEIKHHKITHYDIMYAYKNGPKDAGSNPQDMYNSEYDSAKDLTKDEDMPESHNSEIEPTTGLHVSATDTREENMQTDYTQEDYNEIDKYLEVEQHEESDSSRKERRNDYVVDPNCVDWKNIKVLVSKDKERPFQCLNCDYASKYKAAVKRHFQRHHTGTNNRPYECVNCGFSTKTKDKIALHNRRSISDVAISCNICEYTTLYKCQFVLHQKKEHYENKCNQCEYTSKRKYELEKHYMVVHMGNGLKCRFCEYVAARKESILSHETIHTGVKPYKCEYCDYTGVKSCLLAKHMRRHHPHFMRSVVVVSDSKIETLKQPCITTTAKIKDPSVLSIASSQKPVP